MPGFDTVAVVGAGVMGQGVAHSLAATGHSVVLIDCSEAQLEKSLRQIEKTARLNGLINANATASWEELEANITATTRLEDSCRAEFVIENVTECWDTKRDVHGNLGAIISLECPVAVNTSAIPITRLASLHPQPERVIGMHFMNPVPLMPMVEVIPGMRTANSVIDCAKTLVSQMGKESIVVADSPGFVTNRVMMQMVNEAAFLVDEGVASAESIDRLFKTCFGHKMGPLETADLIGLDTVLKSIDVIREHFGDSKYRPAQVLVRMVEAGYHGRKSGKGFYNYEYGG